MPVRSSLPCLHTVRGRGRGSGESIFASFSMRLRDLSGVRTVVPVLSSGIPGFEILLVQFPSLVFFISAIRLIDYTVKVCIYSDKSKPFGGIMFL